VLSKQQMLKYIDMIDERLKEQGLSGELCLFGGAVMCLVFDSRSATKDIDAIFAPTADFYRIIKNIADEYDLPDDWLNSAVKGFVSTKHDVHLFRELSHLTIYAPSASYLLAMKCLAARADTPDTEDIRFLLQHLNIKSVDQALQLLEQYYPQSRVLPRTQYLLQELLES
jgi:hypothetical protein